MPPQFTFQLAAHSYFRSYHNYFWQWEEQGAIIGIPNGRTIAYTPFVAETLGYLKDQGLPRFGTLLLAILATSRDPEGDITSIIANLKKNFPGLPPLYLGAIESGEQFLLKLAKLPPGYKEGKKRWLALQTIFQSLQHPIRNFFADDIVNLISRNRVDKDVLLRKEIIDPNTIYSDFLPFIQLHKDFPDTASIIKAMGELPEVEEELTLPEETPEPETDFLQELRQCRETAEIAALIPLIRSALEIPRHNRLPGRQPMGGVAGLSNKGEAHRLLVSEFANDDLVFLSRLANNEALYLNRETPPQPGNRERVLLVDVSLKNWGAPHIIALALMLAIARHPKSTIPCSAFAVHENWQPLLFGDIHQVIESLLVLEPCLHPAAGIERFFRENPEKRQAEVFLLSTADTLRLPAMQQAMVKFQQALSYLLLSSHEGSVDWYKKRGQGRQHVKTFQLPGEELWKNCPRATENDDDNPFARFTSAFCPFLLPTPSMIKAVLPLQEDLYIVTHFNALMRKSWKTHRYWELAFENLPPSADYFEIGEMDTGEHVLLAFSSQTKRVFLVNLHLMTRRTQLLHQWGNLRGFVFHKNFFYCTGEGHPIAISPLNPPREPGKGDFPSGRMLLELLEERNALRESTRLSLPPSEKIFKNIDRVWINENLNLVFDDRELVIENDHFLLKPLAPANSAICEAKTSGKNEFHFPNGSTVVVHPAGMLILKDRFLEIFISYFSDEALSLTTHKHYSGNENFVARGLKSERLDVISFDQQFLQPFIQHIVQ